MIYIGVCKNLVSKMVCGSSDKEPKANFNQGLTNGENYQHDFIRNARVKVRGYNFCESKLYYTSKYSLNIDDYSN